jgi:ribosomal subunit interface protein
MQTPLRITFRHMDPSPAAESRIREHVNRLERFHHRMTGCHVVVDAPPAHRNKGAPFDVRIDITIPGGNVHVSTERSSRAEYADVYVALRDAFETAQRALQSHLSEQRDDWRQQASLQH